MKKYKLFFLNDNTICACEGGNIYWRASKQPRRRKTILSRQFATKLLRKRHGIDCGDYA